PEADRLDLCLRRRRQRRARRVSLQCPRSVRSYSHQSSSGDAHLHEGSRPALAWKGKFFDAYTTWFVRAAPFEKPLGDSVVKWTEPPVGGGPEVRFNG